MKHFWQILIFFPLCSILIFSQTSFALSQCDDRIGTCEYYDCISQSLGCSSRSVLRDTAAPFCRLYQADLPNFTFVGQLVLKKIQTCLQGEIARRSGPSCEQASREFVNAHVTCYLSQGFCSLPLHDKYRIGRIGFRRLGKPGFLRSGARIIQGCHDDETRQALIRSGSEARGTMIRAD